MNRLFLLPFAVLFLFTTAASSAQPPATPKVKNAASSKETPPKKQKPVRVRPVKSETSAVAPRPDRTASPPPALPVAAVQATPADSLVVGDQAPDEKESDEPEITGAEPLVPLPASSDPAFLQGEPPAFWEIDSDRRDDALVAVLRGGSIAPPVPAKVVRYAATLLERYDTNGNGVLEQDEWKKMPGAPQSMDINGDLIITLDELVRHIALFGQGRTIHRPHPVPTYSQPSMEANSLQLFHPLGPPPESGPKEKSKSSLEAKAPEESGDDAETRTDETPHDMTTEDMENATIIRRGMTYEELAAEHQIPRERKYYRPLSELRGVPAWFIRHDRDGDGQVSLIEFAPTLTPQALALFGKLDKNGDGLLTPDEVRVPPQTPAAPEKKPNQ